MDELKTYAGRRLELGDMIRAAVHQARATGDKQAEGQARAGTCWPGWPPTRSSSPWPASSAGASPRS